MSTFVVPDFHGNWKLAVGLLEQEGLIEDAGYPWKRLRKDVTVVQLGDLCNCVVSSINDDLMAIKLVGPVIDIMLVGNHEHPYFGGPPFDGFGFFAELKNEILKLNDRGLIQAALEVDGILLTHAGVCASADDIDDWHSDNKAAEFAEGLNGLWRARQYQHSMFSAIGRARGGRHPEGSVLWSDWKEQKTNHFPQIVGHTVGETWRAVGPMNGSPSFFLNRPYTNATPLPVQALCIDIGAGKKSRNILGAWIRDGEVILVEHERN